MDEESHHLPGRLHLMHPNAERVATILREAGVSGKVRELPESARTAVLAAQQIGCDVGAIANGFVFSADADSVLVLTSGAHRMDTSRLDGESAPTRRRGSARASYARTPARRSAASRPPATLDRCAHRSVSHCIRRSGRPAVIRTGSSPRRSTSGSA